MKSLSSWKDLQRQRWREADSNNRRCCDTRTLLNVAAPCERAPVSPTPRNVTSLMFGLNGSLKSCEQWSWSPFIRQQVKLFPKCNLFECLVIFCGLLNSCLAFFFFVPLNMDCVSALDAVSLAIKGGKESFCDEVHLRAYLTSPARWRVWVQLNRWVNVGGCVCVCVCARVRSAKPLKGQTSLVFIRRRQMILLYLNFPY